MIKLLRKPITIIFITIYGLLIFRLLEKPSESDLDDFPWGCTYLQNYEGEYMGIGEASYHFKSQDDS